MKVISHIEDNVMSIAIELGGSGLARIVASTSSHIIRVSRFGNSISRGNVDLAISTTIGASRERGDLGDGSDISKNLSEKGKRK